MEEVKIKNRRNIKVYINGTPDFDSVPKDLLDSFIFYLEEQIQKGIRRKHKKSRRINDGLKENKE